MRPQRIHGGNHAVVMPAPIDLHASMRPQLLLLRKTSSTPLFLSPYRVTCNEAANSPRKPNEKHENNLAKFKLQ